MKLHLTYEALYRAAEAACNQLTEAPTRIYAVPRGGIPAALFVAWNFPGAKLVEHAADADLIVDDIIDTGRTAARYITEENLPVPFLTLYGRDDTEYPANVIIGDRLRKDVWVVFPWESPDETATTDDSIAGTIRNRILHAGLPFNANDNIAAWIDPGELTTLQDEVEERVQALLEALVIDTDNDHNTRGTAKRVAKMLMQETMCGRYTPLPRITSFPNAKHLDELYLSGPIAVRSTCSHHFMPITGSCWIGVIPGEEVIGLSKFNRLVDWVMSRGQIQEEATVQIADLLENLLKPKGLAVVVKAQHHCLTHRGVRAHDDSEMTTSVMRGLMRDKPEARAEFLSLLR